MSIQFKKVRSLNKDKKKDKDKDKNKNRNRNKGKELNVKHIVLKIISLFVISLIVNKSRLIVNCLNKKWTVGIPGGLDEANNVASEHGCINLGLVRGFNDVYLFEKQVKEKNLVKNNNQDYDDDDDDESSGHRTKRALESHPCVLWVDPQTPQERVKRDLINKLQLALTTPHHIQLIAPQPSSVSSSTSSVSSSVSSNNMNNFKQAGFDRGIYSTFISSNEGKKFNDELWTHQWYLQENSNVAQLQSDIELKVEEVWKMGITGNGIVVTILDDGLEWNHTDIYPNYDARASWDMNNNKSDPFPRYDSYDTNSHGTRCAGEVAMVANNKKCGVGVAPKARIGGIKCLDGQVSDHIESMSLLHNIDHIDIYSGSWGPMDNGQTVDGPKRLASQALEKGIKYGRKGKGALYIWANGNGGALGDNCNCDGYVNSIYTISIGGVTQQGQIPFYGERCSSTLAVTCSSGAYTDRKIVTTDLHNKCTVDYTGTSAAAPLAAGIYALVLEANKNLTWRDAQHLTAWTSNPIPIKDNLGWKRNAAGLIFNSRFGFGLLNAKAMVDAALNWQNVPKKSICIVSSSSRLPIFLQSRSMAHAVFVSDGCQREFENQQQKKQHQSLTISSNSGTGVFSANIPTSTRKQTASSKLGHLNIRSPSSSTTTTSRQMGLLNQSLNSQQQQQQPSPVIYLEHVQLVIDIEYTSRGCLDIFIISPSGTVSTLLSRRPLDVSRSGFDKWPLMSIHFWGETSYGKWTVIVRDKDSQNNRGLLRNATLILHGTTLRPLHMMQKRIYDTDEGQVQSFIDPVLEIDEDDIYDLNTFPNEMSLVRDDSYQPNFIKSLIAMEQSNRLKQ